MSVNNVSDAYGVFLNFCDKNHKTIADNIANVNTPNFKSKGLNQDFSSMVSRHSAKLSLYATTAMHITEKNGKNSGFESVNLTSDIEAKPNGNNVSLSNEVMKMSENANARYEALKEYQKLADLVSMSIITRG